jgi:hypothetical protein
MNGLVNIAVYCHSRQESVGWYVPIAIGGWVLRSVKLAVAAVSDRMQWY